MLLSIVMMVRNEGKILDRTLKSLEQLREKIDSELIILDTGSIDNTVDIAKKYTDKVYFEKWNNDFSSMRNKSISYAKGKWLLIIDADEVLTNFNKLIMFFDKKLDDKYNSATIRMKNIYTYDEKRYGHCSVVRFFKRENFRYEGIIHEQPIFSTPIYNDLLDFNHYGYLFEDEELRERKVKRNEELLLKQLESNPKDAYTNYQLGKNLIGEGKFLEAEEYLEKAYKYYRKLGISPEYVYINLAKTYLNIGKNIKCESFCKKYISKDKNNIDMYYYLAHSQLNQGKYEECMISYKRYIYLVDNYDITTQANSIYCDSDTIGLNDYSISIVIKILIKLEKYNEVEFYFNKIEDYKVRKGCYSQLFISLEKCGNEDKILEYYGNIPDSYIEKNEFYNNIEIFIDSLKLKDKNKIYKLFSNLDNNYGLLSKIRFENKVTQDECIKLLNDEKEVIYGKILNVAMNNDLDLINIISDLDSVWIEKYILISIKSNRNILPKLYNDIMNLSNTFDIEKIRVYKLITKILLESNSLDNEKYFELFYINNMYSYQYIKTIYKDFSDKEIIRLLSNDDDRFTIEFRNLVQIDYTEEEKVKIIKSLLIEYPYYKKILEKLIETLIKEINQPEELKILKNQFIQNIINMVNENNIADAKNMINEYLEIFDYNVEVLNIKGVIEYISGNKKEADILFKKAISLDLYNEDTIYNIENLYM